ncbi:Deoxyribodipyrimidine photo-lyase [Dichanthelium oligosanthes]|uniref:Deoxyribodipyrimidine photo-lyase n=1 Tax=Dichanthelium oligosanthes TaxID=888268 RepID=A0A1E5V819_9POAL|nr:Deoxyribodipyrimidine photo-lyase [Dichanthelium oligosanthes]
MPPATAPASPTPVHPSRVRVLHPGGGRATGPVVYWMLRDQRLADNWALVHAAGLAAASAPAAPLAIAFALFPRPFLLGARRRQLGFLLRGLRRLAADARSRGIPFFLLEGGPAEVPALVRRLGASALVADFSPLRPVQEALDAVVGELRRDAADMAVHQVDAHNVVPVWAASGKLEYSAKTFRGKVSKVMDEYLVEYTELPALMPWNGEQPEDVDWGALIDRVCRREELENAKTYDHLWNASQLEMVHHGKMHGFMRMYWAKKILEWTSGPEEALSAAIYLNDKYHIDGRDPNGYVGCMWSICGLHDQGWKERPVFGKIRYMNYAGCKRKFDVDAYISYVKRLVTQAKKRKAEESPDTGSKHRKSEVVQQLNMPKTLI